MQCWSRNSETFGRTLGFQQHWLKIQSGPILRSWHTEASQQDVCGTHGGFLCQQLVWTTRSSMPAASVDNREFLVPLGLWSLGSKRVSWLIYFPFHSNCPEIELKNKVQRWFHEKLTEQVSHVGPDREKKTPLGWNLVLTPSAAVTASLWCLSLGTWEAEDWLLTCLYWSARVPQCIYCQPNYRTCFWSSCVTMPKMIS